MPKRISVPEGSVETLFGSYDENLKHLEVLDRLDCTHDDAMKAWDALFYTDWFSKQPDPSKKSKIEKASGPAVIKQGESRYAKDGINDYVVNGQTDAVDLRQQITRERE